MDELLAKLLSEDQENAKIAPDTLKQVIGIALQALLAEGKQSEPLYQALLENILYLDRHGTLTVAP